MAAHPLAGLPRGRGDALPETLPDTLAGLSRARLRRLHGHRLFAVSPHGLSHYSVRVTVQCTRNWPARLVVAERRENPSGTYGEVATNSLSFSAASVELCRLLERWPAEPEWPADASACEQRLRERFEQLLSDETLFAVEPFALG